MLTLLGGIGVNGVVNPPMLTLLGWIGLPVRLFPLCGGEWVGLPYRVVYSPIVEGNRGNRVYRVVTWLMVIYTI